MKYLFVTLATLWGFAVGFGWSKDCKADSISFIYDANGNAAGTVLTFGSAPTTIYNPNPGY